MLSPKMPLIYLPENPGTSSKGNEASALISFPLISTNTLPFKRFDTVGCSAIKVLISSEVREIFACLFLLKSLSFFFLF